MPPKTSRRIVGLDVNASRARAMLAVPGAGAVSLPLEDTSLELPMAIALDGAKPRLGRPGLAYCRCLPHLSCLDFLASLGRPRVWARGALRLDGRQAVELVLGHLATLCSASEVTLSLPGYLEPAQVELLVRLAESSGLPARGWMTTPLGLALAAAADSPWIGPALIADVDDHAFTWTAVHASDRCVRVLDSESIPALGLRAWRERLLDTIADRCIRQSRRDPRASAEAEQGLFDQLDAVLDASRRGQTVELIVRMTNWGQNLFLRPADLAEGCSGLLGRVLGSFRRMTASLAPGTGTPVVVMSDAVGRLPGLVAALEADVGLPTEADLEDFSLTVRDGDEDLPSMVRVLSPEAAARAACEATGRRVVGIIPPGALVAAPLPPPISLEAGPARLQFRNQDYPLQNRPFVLGRHADCDLVFDGDLYPTVSGRHCEIVCENNLFLVRDRSRSGTLVNERPVIRERILAAGDWIRLGPGGPMARFVGQLLDPLVLLPTA